QSHIEALSGNRMDDVGGVSDQRQPLADECARRKKAERKRTPRPADFNITELQAEALLKLNVKLAVGQRNNALCFAGSLGPDDRAAPARERQDRKRPRGQEMLLGTAIVRALMRNRRDDCGLVVVPSVCGDTGPLADQGVSTIGANQKARRDGVVAGKL